MPKKAPKLTLDNINYKCTGGSVAMELYNNGALKSFSCVIPDELQFENSINNVCDDYYKILQKEERGSIDVVGDIRRKKDEVKDSYIYNKYCKRAPSKPVSAKKTTL